MDRKSARLQRNAKVDKQSEVPRLCGSIWDQPYSRNPYHGYLGRMWLEGAKALPLRNRKVRSSLLPRQQASWCSDWQTSRILGAAYDRLHYLPLLTGRRMQSRRGSFNWVFKHFAKFDGSTKTAAIELNRLLSLFVRID